VRSAAAYALGRQPSLSQEILARLVAAALEDGDSGVRSEAATALGRQPSLSQEILKCLVLHLNESSKGLQEITGILIKQECFYSTFPTLEISQLKLLYRELLKTSFREQLGFYVRDKRLFIEMAEGIREISFKNDEQQGKYETATREARSELEVPSYIE